jgi:branched-chain amino acid transport system permease protein
VSQSVRGSIYFGIMALLIIGVGLLQSWSVSLTLLNLGLISAVMALGLNIQWGYAGLFNAGVMGFAALGGLAGVLVSEAPVAEAWAAGGAGMLYTVLALAATVFAAWFVYRRLRRGPHRALLVGVVVLVGYIVIRGFFDPAVDAIEAVDPSKTGFLGGLGLPIIFAWAVGGVLAAGAAWLVGRISLGLRSDYLAIATLGISEIVIAILKNEDWLARGVKNVTGLDRPVPYEVDLQSEPWFIDLVKWFNTGATDDALQAAIIEGSGLFVKGAYALLFVVALLALLWFSERALRSPWGRMMRAIRDNEHAAQAMGKHVTKRHLQVFILGSAVIGIAGAMLTTLDGQFTPGTYNPLRFTFLIWVMVIVGGSGNNWGSVLGGFLIWFVWVEAEPVGQWLMSTLTAGMAEDNVLRQHLVESASHMRMIFMGVLLLVVLRFSPKGLLPEVVRR